MLVVRCPEVRAGRGERLVSEQRIVGLEGTGSGFLVTVRCPCGQRHAVPVPRLAELPGERVA